MRVELLAHTPEPERLVAAAAKLCYSKSGAADLLDHLDEDAVAGFLTKLMALGHDSPLEHMSFTFAVDGVSRVLTHQLVRHRMASYSQQSQRYVKLDQFEYVIPPAIQAVPAAKALFIQAMEADQKAYDQLVGILEKDLYESLIATGLSEKKARAQAEKTAIEDARYVFPNACETKIVLTMNARGLINFFEHRCCERAQWEIRQLAAEMLKLVRGAAPLVFNEIGPKCLKGPCPEGTMTCGKILEVRKNYQNL